MLSKAAALARELAPRKKGLRKKRPTELVMRVTEPEFLRADYALQVKEGRRAKESCWADCVKRRRGRGSGQCV